MGNILNSYKTHQALYLFSFTTLCALLFAIGMHEGEKLCLYLAGISGALCLSVEWLRLNRPSIPAFFIAPVLFLIYVLLSPGTFFIDARLAGRFACALFAGIAFQVFFSKYTRNMLLLSCIAFLLTLSIGLVYAALFAPEMFAGRLTLTYGNPHRLAAAGAFSIFILFTFLKSFSKRVHPAIYCLVVIISTAIFLTVSRSTFLGLLFAFAAYTLFNRAKHLLKISAAICLLGVVTFSILPTHQQQRLISPFTAPLSDHTTKQRVGIWYTAVQGIKESPIIGHGLRAYSDYDEQYKNNYKSEIKAKNIYIEERRWAHPHSLYLGSLFGWGTIGSLLLIISFILALRYSSGRIKTFVILMTCFNLGYGLTELRIKSHDGAFFLFFPLGMAYGSILYEHYSGVLKNHLPESKLLNAFTHKAENVS